MVKGASVRLSATILFCCCLAGCTAHLELERPVVTTEPVKWLASVRGEDAYLQISVQTYGPDPAQSQPTTRSCSSNLFQRWVDREGSAVIIMSLDGAAATPVLSNDISDKSGTCQLLYKTRPVGPSMLIATAEGPAVTVEFKSVNDASSSIKVAQ